eukprot:7380025-Prymnesium_polylepis.1
MRASSVGGCMRLPLESLPSPGGPGSLMRAACCRAVWSSRSCLSAARGEQAEAGTGGRHWTGDHVHEHRAATSHGPHGHAEFWNVRARLLNQCGSMKKVGKHGRD